MVDRLNGDKALPSRLASLRRALQRLSYATLRISLESIRLTLMLLGLPLAFALLLVGTDPNALFSEIQNLCAHYLGASELARSQFNAALRLGFWGLLALSLLLRLPALWRDIGQNTLTQGNPSNE